MKTVQEQIMERQNSEEMLKCQYVARYFFNSAERTGYIWLFFSLLSVLLVLLPVPKTGFLKLIHTWAPYILQVIILVSYYIICSRISKASMIRNYYDSVVLGFDELKDNDNHNKIQEIVMDVSKRKSEECSVQIRNTGKDNPMGVKDWYTFPPVFSDAVFECQKQNQWWDRKLTRARLIIEFIALLAGIVIFFLVLVFNVVTPGRAALCGIGFLITFSESIIENFKYIQKSIQIDNDCKMLEESRLRNQLVLLQKHINERREIKIAGFDFLHKLMNPRITEDYEKGSSI